MELSSQGRTRIPEQKSRMCLVKGVGAGFKDKIRAQHGEVCPESQYSGGWAEDHVCSRPGQQNTTERKRRCV